METRAPFVIVGAFVLAAIAAVFGFVYWLHNTAGLGPRTTYHVQFDGSVPGLLVGAAVLFNGIRVGEVTELGLAPDNPRRVNATISVASTTPVRPDTRVGLEFQGLTGVPVVALEGGTAPTNCRRRADADRGARRGPEHDPGRARCVAQGRFRAQRKFRADQGHHRQSAGFSEGLARNTGKLDGIVAGLERMTGASTPPPKITYDLRAAAGSRAAGQDAQGTVGDPGADRGHDAARRSASCSRRPARFRVLPTPCGPTRFRDCCRRG